jgi:hypothetical protein
VTELPAEVLEQIERGKGYVADFVGGKWQITKGNEIVAASASLTDVARVVAPDMDDEVLALLERVGAGEGRVCNLRKRIPETA